VDHEQQCAIESNNWQLEEVKPWPLEIQRKVDSKSGQSESPKQPLDVAVQNDKSVDAYSTGIALRKRRKKRVYKRK